MNITENRSRTYHLVLSALFTALISASAFVKVPIGIVPVTLQLGTVLLISLLYRRRAFIPFSVYLLMGLGGLPVFAAGGGPAYILKPTFGYLLGMLLVTVIVGNLSERYGNSGFTGNLLFCLLGIGVCYAVGLTYMAMVMRFIMERTVIPGRMIYSGAIVFIPTDIVWACAASIIASRFSRVSSR